MPRQKPVTMALTDGRTRAFDNLQDALRWANGEENGGQPLPRNNAKVSVSMPEELKEFLRDSGKMSTQLRGLAMKATGAQWKSTERQKQGARVTRLRPGRPKKARYA